MKHIAAFALLVLGGNASPSAADVEKVLTAAGVKADSGKVAALVESLSGKNFHEVVAEGLKVLSSFGGAPVAAAASSSKVEAKVEAKKEEPKEEEVDVDMGDLFGY